MTTGIDFENSRDTKTLYETEKNSVEFVLSRDKKYDPGVVFHYHDGAPQLVSAAVQKRFGAPFLRGGKNQPRKPKNQLYVNKGRLAFFNFVGGRTLWEQLSAAYIVTNYKKEPLH